MNVPPGTVVGGRYRIDALLGRGTAGAVYRAVDRSGRSCAIKMLQPVHCPNPKSVEVFVEQARLAASLHHPSIRAVWNAGIDDLLGSPFITMELLDGSDVATHLREVGAFTATSLRRVLEQVADAVAWVVEEAGGNACVVVDLLGDFRRQGFIGLPHFVEADDDGVAGVEFEVLLGFRRFLVLLHGFEDAPHAGGEGAIGFHHDGGAVDEPLGDADSAHAVGEFLFEPLSQRFGLGVGE